MCASDQEAGAFSVARVEVGVTRSRLHSCRAEWGNDSQSCLGLGAGVKIKFNTTQVWEDPTCPPPTQRNAIASVETCLVSQLCLSSPVTSHRLYSCSGSR